MDLSCPTCGEDMNITQADYSKELGMTICECLECGYTGPICDFQSPQETEVED